MTHVDGVRRELCLLKTSSSGQSLTFPSSGTNSPALIIPLLCALLATARSSLKSRRELALENLALRQRLVVLKRQTKRTKLSTGTAHSGSRFRVCGQTGRTPPLTHADRAFWVAVSRLWTGWEHALILVKPETVIC